MRVVREGKLPEPKKYRGTCPNCRCVIEVSENEINWEEDRGRDFPVWLGNCPTKGCTNNAFYVYPINEWKIHELDV